MTMKYILNSRGEPEVCEDLMTWAAWFEKADRRVGLTEVDDWVVSTVFLAINYNPFHGAPILWESMVFKGPEGLWFDRCSGSKEQAEAMHMRMVHRMKEEIRKGEHAACKVRHMI